MIWRGGIVQYAGKFSALLRSISTSILINADYRLCLYVRPRIIRKTKVHFTSTCTHNPTSCFILPFKTTGDLELKPNEIPPYLQLWLPLQQ